MCEYNLYILQAACHRLIIHFYTRRRRHKIINTMCSCLCSIAFDMSNDMGISVNGYKGCENKQ